MLVALKEIKASMKSEELEQYESFTNTNFKKQ